MPHMAPRTAPAPSMRKSSFCVRDSLKACPCSYFDYFWKSLRWKGLSESYVMKLERVLHVAQIDA